jgi:GGDEF domain-containing protein
MPVSRGDSAHPHNEDGPLKPAATCIDGVMRKADQASCAAKADGRNQVVIG